MARLGGIDSMYADHSAQSLSGGFLYFYETGTTTPKTTFSDSAMLYQNTWPIELDAAGVPPPVFYTDSAKVVLKDKDGTTLRTVDPISAPEFATGETIVYRLGDIDSQFFSNDRFEDLAGGKLYIYYNGSSTPKTTYSDNAMTTENDWPIVLDADGFIPDVFYKGKARIVLTDAAGVQQRIVDEVESVEVDSSFILSCPADIVVSEGDFVTFCVGVTGDPAGYTYQWYKNLTAQTGETDQCYSFQVVAGDDNVEVWVETSDGTSVEQCPFATLTVGNPGCVTWSVSTSTVTAEDFWVSPTTETLATFDARLALDTLIINRNDEVYIRHGSNVVYTNDFGATFSTVTLASLIPIDYIWDTGEKTSATFTGAAWPNGAPSSNFSLTAWKWSGDNLLACFYNSDSDSGFIANITIDQAIVTGFTYNTNLETSTLGEDWVGVPYLPANELHTFCFWDGELTLVGNVFESYPTDPYPHRHAMLKGSIAKANAVTLSEGKGAPVRAEIVNDNLLWYGAWGGGSGGAVATRYGMIASDIQLGGSYTFDASWRQPGGYALAWWADSAPTYQPTKTTTLLASIVDNYPTTNKQRAAQWLSTDEMFAGVVSKRYGYTYTDLADAVERDYSSIFNYAGRDAFEVMPIKEKGAFISAEIINTNLRSTTIKISKDSDPAHFSSAVTLTLPVAKHTNGDEITLAYSASQAKFLLAYFDNSSKIHVVSFDDPFDCTATE